MPPPPANDPRFSARMTLIAESEIAATLPRRSRGAHKGDFGRVLIVGGGVGMPGAARLAGEACLRVGAGLVTVAVAPENVAAIAAGRPELICLPLRNPGELGETMKPMDVIAVGPGLGRGEGAREALNEVLKSGKPVVMDADALNLLAAHEADPLGFEDSAQPTDTAVGWAESAKPNITVRPWILTPHPGEAARLLGVTTEEIQRDRPQSLERLIEKYQCIVVLKGAGTLVGAPAQTPGLCDRGNPGMATAGMGDVLTGIIAGVLAQCRDPWAAARVGVLVHAMAGDRAARTGERGLIASDVIRELRACINH